MPDLITSILDTIKGVLNSILAAFESVFSLAGTVVSDVASLGKSLVDLILGKCSLASVLLYFLFPLSSRSGRWVNKRANGATAAAVPAPDRYGAHPSPFPSIPSSHSEFRNSPQWPVF